MTDSSRWSERLIYAVLPLADAEEVVGDLREEWPDSRLGLRARVRFTWAVLSIVMHYLVRGRGRFDLGTDLRLALRRLRRDPTFTAVAVLAIGLGIGVNTLILAIGETVLFAPLPYPEEDRLAVLTNDHSGSSTGGFGVSYANIRDVRERAGSLEDLAVYMDWQDVTLQTADGAFLLPTAFVSSEYVALLGLRARHGRFFSADEARENAPASVAVLGHGAWRTLYGADPGIVGRTVVLNGEPFEVVGVADDDRGDLRYLWGDEPVSVYLPLFNAERLVGMELDEERGARYLNGLLRLRPGRTVEDAQAELAELSRDLAADFPDANEGWSYRVEALDEALYDELRTPTSALIGISALVFLLIAVNLLTLVLLRAAGRSDDVAVRRALGAGSGRIFTQLAAESALLGCLGWVLGLLLGMWTLELFAVSDAVRLPEFADVALEGRVLGVTLAAAMLLAAILAAVPTMALLAGRGGATALPGGGARGSAGRSRSLLRNGLVAAEIAVAFVLLIGAGLLLESFRTLRATGYGFDTERLLLAQIDVRAAALEGDELLALTSALETRAEALPNAEDAFIWAPNRLGHGNRVEILTAEGRWLTAPEERIEASQHALHPGTLESLGIPLLQGRDVSGGDRTDGPRVVIVSESLARALWPGEEAVGRSIETEEGGEVITIRVIGVVADARHRTRLIEPFEDQRDVYYPFAQQSWGTLTLAVRHAPDADLEPLAQGVRALTRELAPTAPVHGVTTMEDEMRAEEGPARLGALLVGGYAALAVLLAALGLYGVLAHGVRLQLREIGIRMALGEDRGRVVGRLVRRGMSMTGLGLGVGFLIALPAARLLSAALYGVEPMSGRVFLAVSLALATVALLSCLLPSGRAVRVAPADVLRSD